MSAGAAGSLPLRDRLLALAARALVDLVQLLPRQTALGIAGRLGRAYVRLGGPRTSVGRASFPSSAAWPAPGVDRRASPCTPELPVLPVFIERDGETPRHRVRIHPALEILPAGDDREGVIRENARRMTRVIEEEIRRVPDHWIWAHRRWRTQPKGEPNPYPSRHGRSLIR